MPDVDHKPMERGINDPRTLKIKRESCETMGESSAQNSDELAKLKQQFLGMISHEMRTPLNAVIGYTEVLINRMIGQVDDAAREVLQRIYFNAERELQLIVDVLDLATIEYDEIVIDNRLFDLGLVIQEWHARMRMLSGGQVGFAVVLDDQMPTLLMGDRVRLSQAINHLLSNAFKFTREGSVSLRIQPDTDAQQWSITVTDTGIGIAAQQLPHIFDSFYQSESGLDRRFHGIGVGLTIAAGIIKKMGGLITVSSVLDKGSEFKVTLPLQKYVTPAA